MQFFVLDASATIAGLLQEEEHPGVEKVFNLLEEDESEAVAPSLWHIETRGAIIKAMRRYRQDADWLKGKFSALTNLKVHTDDHLNLEDACNLAVKHGLSLQDGVYLELAKRLDLPLATLDRALIKAAAAEGVSLTCK